MRSDDATPLMLGLLTAILILLAFLTLGQEPQGAADPAPSPVATVDPLPEVSAPTYSGEVLQRIRHDWPRLAVAFVLLTCSLFAFARVPRIARWIANRS